MLHSLQLCSLVHICGIVVIHKQLITTTYLESAVAVGVAHRIPDWSFHTVWLLGLKL